MRIWHSVVLCFVLCGCALPRNSANSAESGFVMGKICNAKLYEISISEIALNEQSQMSKGDFEKILKQAISESGCFSVKGANAAYQLQVQYALKSTATEEERLISVKSSASVSAFVKFTLRNDKRTITQEAQSEISNKGSLYFGIGENAKITQSQQEEALKRALAHIFENLKNQAKSI